MPKSGGQAARRQRPDGQAARRQRPDGNGQTARRPHGTGQAAIWPPAVGAVSRERRESEGGSQIHSIGSVSHVLPISACTDWYAEPCVIERVRTPPQPWICAWNPPNGAFRVAYQSVEVILDRARPLGRVRLARPRDRGPSEARAEFARGNRGRGAACSSCDLELQGVVPGHAPRRGGGPAPGLPRRVVFRWNRRRTPMAGFQTLLGLGTHREPTT